LRLLILRPQPDAARTAAALRARGHDAVAAPLIKIETLAQIDPGAGPWAAFLVTSANAVRGIAGHAQRHDVRNVPVFTVGARTAGVIRQHGFTAVSSADGNVNELVKLVAARLIPPARLLYLSGEELSGDIARDLRAKGFAVDTVIVYRAVVVEKLPQTAIDALASGVDAVLHYSRRSAEAYVNAARCSDVLASALKPVHLCLSARVAEPLRSAGTTAIKIAPRPNEAALLGLIGPDRR
jgi:uroporphyrinogen-III synthase